MTATLATCAAAVSHTFADAAAPSLFAVALAVVLTAPLAVFALGRKHTKGALAVAVLLTQLLFHWVFIWCTPASLKLFETAGSHQHGHTAAAHFDFAAATTATAGHSAQMLVAHVIAALFALALLLTAEHAYGFILGYTTAAVRAVGLLRGGGSIHTPKNLRLPQFAVPSLKTQILLLSRGLRAPPVRAVS
ncbi:hypothetical protein [Canibacter oris]|uniref:Uncharacterized protein n=1 Tax=Canibacter oris TaxID=1365628 RepID=A0A840DKF9_9MICO|nr:hypothetical protein [Canibacter oris]MBB4071962.1 hypothetical protein [Canibacter oris]